MIQSSYLVSRRWIAAAAKDLLVKSGTNDTRPLDMSVAHGSTGFPRQTLKPQQEMLFKPYMPP